MYSTYLLSLLKTADYRKFNIILGLKNNPNISKNKELIHTNVEIEVS